MYALYYDYDDPKRKAIPKLVAKWMDENIGTTRKIRDGQRRDGSRGEGVEIGITSPGIRTLILICQSRF